MLKLFRKEKEKNIEILRKDYEELKTSLEMISKDLSVIDVLCKGKDTLADKEIEDASIRCYKLLRTLS